MTVYIIIESELHTDRTRIGSVYSDIRRAIKHVTRENNREKEVIQSGRCSSDYDENFFGTAYVAKEIE